MRTQTIFCTTPNNAAGVDVTDGFFSFGVLSLQEIGLSPNFGGCRIISAGVMMPIPANVSAGLIQAGALVFPIEIKIYNSGPQGSQTERLFLPAANVLQSCSIPLYGFKADGILVEISGFGECLDKTYNAAGVLPWVQFVIESATNNSPIGIYQNGGLV